MSERSFKRQRPASVNRRLWLAAGLAAVGLLTAVAWLRWRPREAELPPPRLVPLASLSGSEVRPHLLARRRPGRLRVARGEGRQRRHLSQDGWVLGDPP